MQNKTALKYLEFFFLIGLILRFLISGRIYYWSNYLFLFWFSICYLLVLVLTRASSPLPRLLKLAFALFFGGMSLSLILSIAPLYTGRELMIFLGYLFIFLSSWEIFKTQKLERIIIATILAGLIQALMGLRQYLGGLDTLQNLLSPSQLASMEQISLKRVFGFTFSPDFFSCFLGVSLIIIFAYAEKLFRQSTPLKISKIFLLFLLFLVLFIPLFLSKSLGGFLSFFIGSSTFFYLNFPQSRLKGKKITFLLVLVLLAFIVFSFFLYQRRNLIFQHQNNPVLLRFYNFQAGLKVYLENPFSGIGLGNFWIAYPRYRQAQANETRYVHNNFIQVLAEAGPIAEAGFILLTVYLVLCFKKIRAGNDEFLIGFFSGLIALLVHWLWDFGLYVPELASLFWVLFGGLTAKLEPENSQPISRLTLGLLGFLLLILWAISVIIFAEQRLIKRAEKYFQMRNLKQTELYAQRALKILPFDDYAYGLLAFSASDKKEKEVVAIGYFQKAIQFNPRFSFWHKHLGDYYFKNDKLLSAESEYLKALELYPNHIESLAKMAQIRRLQGDLDGAEKYAQRALLVSGNQRPALWEMVKIKRIKGENGKMLKSLQELSERYQDPEAKKILKRYTEEGTE